MELLAELLHKTILASIDAMVGFEQAEMANFSTFVGSMATEVVALGINMQDFEKQALGTCFGVQATMAFLMHRIDPWVHYKYYKGLAILVMKGNYQQGVFQNKEHKLK